MYPVQGQEFCAPASQNWPLLSKSEVVNNGFEILSVGFGDIGGIDERLIADALTANIIANLLTSGLDVGKTLTEPSKKERKRRTM